jgi:putative transposase
MVRILSVVDAFTRECLALEPDVSLGSGRVTRVLEAVIAEDGRPESLWSDNGPELTSRHFLAWALEWKIELPHPAGQANAERACGELPRQAAGRVPAGQLVHQPVRRTQKSY